MEKIEIFDHGENLEGVGKINGKICFVDYALAGEICECELLSDNKFFLTYKLKNILKESEDRTKPRCKYFEICGGCDCLHIKHEAQLKIKKENLKRLFQKNNIDAKIFDVVSKNEFNYRNKMVFPVAKQNGETVVGMFKKNTHEVIEIEKCPIANEKINECLLRVKNYIKQNNIQPFDFEKKEGFLKYIVLRNVENKISLVFVVDKKNENVFKNLELIKADQIYLNVNCSNKEILGKGLELLFGKEKIFSNEFDVIYEVNPLAFMQVNNEIKNEIYTEVLNNVDGKIVIDAYSGAGLLSAIITKKAKFVYGVELCKEASKCADELKQKNGIKNLKNINGDCGKILPNLTKKTGEEFTLIVDPPRAGVSKNVLEIVNKNKLCKEILYISCNPKTLVRDIKILSNFDIVFVKPYDMFPQTKHIETFVKLIRKEKNERI